MLKNEFDCPACYGDTASAEAEHSAASVYTAFGPLRTGTKQATSGHEGGEEDVAARVKRPSNSFFLYAKHQRAVVRNTLQIAAGGRDTVRSALWKMAEQSFHSLGPTPSTKKRRVEKCTIPSEEWLDTLKTSPAQPMKWRCHTESTISNSVISQILGRQWSHLKATDPVAIAAYEMEQFVVAEHHKVVHPGYKYKPTEKKAKKVGRPRLRKSASKCKPNFASDLTLAQLSVFNTQSQITQSAEQDRFQSWLHASNVSTTAVTAPLAYIPILENPTHDGLPDLVPVPQFAATPVILSEADNLAYLDADAGSDTGESGNDESV
jgi:hypothetical protein